MFCSLLYLCDYCRDLWVIMLDKYLTGDCTVLRKAGNERVHELVLPVQQM